MRRSVCKTFCFEASHAKANGVCGYVLWAAGYKADSDMCSNFSRKNRAGARASKMNENKQIAIKD